MSGPYRCKVCPESFKSAEELRLHMFLHIK
ncbi:MAG TPA: C2H2-type zinc finger protein [Trebonia sp.]